MDWSGVKVSTEVQNGKKSMIRINGMTMASVSMFVCSGLSLKIIFFLERVVGGHEVLLQESRERKLHASLFSNKENGGIQASIL